MIGILSCLLNNQRINCFSDIYSKEQLKKWADKNILLCPACGKPYEYCHGRIVQPYFRHKDKNQCESKYSEPETEEHLQGKRDLYEWIKKQSGVTDVILEGWIPETKQRPDIMFKYNEKQCVLEFQCSPISSEYYERHELYQAAGIEDIWILGTDKYLEKEENEKSKKFRTKEIEYNTNFYYDSEFKIFVIKDNISITKDIMNYKYFKDTFYYSYSNSYGAINYRKINDEIIKICNNKIFVNLDNLTFENNNIVFSDDIIKSINKYYDLKNKEKIRYDNNVIKTKNYFEKVFKIFYDKYFYKIKFTPCSNGLTFLFFDENIYVSVDKYPNLLLYRLCSTDFKFSFNIDDFKVDQMVDYLYNRSFKFCEARKHYDILNKFKKYRNRKIYLLFAEDKDKKVPENIRFKFIKEYYDDKEDNAEILLDCFKFLNKIKSKDFVLMIPYKKIKYGWFQNYKVRNYKENVINDFHNYGLTNIYFYEDLIKEYE